MERNRLDSDDAVGGNLNGTEDADLIIAAGELVSAGGGNDVVRVNEGGNTVIGLGAGRDVLRLNEEGAQARVLDFEPGVDRINLRSLGVEDFDDLDIDTLASVNDPAEGTIIRAGGAEIRLLDVDPDELSAENFRFAANDDDDVEEAEAADDDDDDVEEAEAADEDDDEVEETEAADDDDDNLNVIDGSDFDPGQFFNAQELEGTGGDDLIIVADDAENRVNAGGGNDTIQGFGGGVDIVDSGAGNDTLVANNNSSIVLTDFNANRDTFDFSGIDGVNNLGDIEITADADSDEDFLGLTEVKAGDSTRFFVSEETGEALDEDNFDFADDAVA